LVAYGKPISSVDVAELFKKINDAAEQLQDDCLSLLDASAEIAISNPICKDILLK